MNDDIVPATPVRHARVAVTALYVQVTLALGFLLLVLAGALRAG